MTEPRTLVHFYTRCAVWALGQFGGAPGDSFWGLGALGVHVLGLSGQFWTILPPTTEYKTETSSWASTRVRCSAPRRSSEPDPPFWTLNAALPQNDAQGGSTPYDWPHLALPGQRDRLPARRSVPEFGTYVRCITPLRLHDLQ